MGKCKDCKHWERLTKEEWDKTGPSPAGGICNAAVFVDFDGYLVNEKTPLANDGLGAKDGSQYSANVVTGPDFGCIKFEPK